MLIVGGVFGAQFAFNDFQGITWLPLGLVGKRQVGQYSNLAVGVVGGLGPG